VATTVEAATGWKSWTLRRHRDAVFASAGIRQKPRNAYSSEEFERLVQAATEIKMEGVKTSVVDLEKLSQTQIQQVLDLPAVKEYFAARSLQVAKDDDASLRQTTGENTLLRQQVETLQAALEGLENENADIQLNLEQARERIGELEIVDPDDLGEEPTFTTTLGCTRSSPRPHAGHWRHRNSKHRCSDHLSGSWMSIPRCGRSSSLDREGR
jgi:hypothetical protein